MVSCTFDMVTVIECQKYISSLKCQDFIHKNVYGIDIRSIIVQLTYMSYK